MKKLKFKKQMKKIMEAYYGNDLCPFHIEHTFATVLLNGHTSWVLGAQIEPGITFADVAPTAEEMDSFKSLKDIFDHAKIASDKFTAAQDSDNKEFWEAGGKFIVDEEHPEPLYIGGLLVHNESRGQYTLEDIIALQNIFTSVAVLNGGDEEALYGAVGTTLELLARIHASQGEDVMAFEFERRSI